MTTCIVHASCVAIAGRGVLLVGPSGAGKSDVALQLIDGGATLVSDDRTRIAIGEGRPLASPPPTIAGKLEVRGIGIVELAYFEAIPLFLAVDLGPPATRLPSAGANYDIAGVMLPLIQVDPRGASAVAKIRLFLAQAA